MTDGLAVELFLLVCPCLQAKERPPPVGLPVGVSPHAGCWLFSPFGQKAKIQEHSVYFPIAG